MRVEPSPERSGEVNGSVRAVKCPFGGGGSDRDDRLLHASQFTVRTGSIQQDPDSGEWFVSDPRLARQVLRETTARQAGFESDQVNEMGGQRSLLFLTGLEHRQQRTKAARFFTPKAVREKYEPLMRRETDRALAAVRRGEVPLDAVAMEYSVAVARQIVGLTEAPLHRLAARMQAFFGQTSSPGRLRQQLYRSKQLINLSSFYLLDVWPAIRARRAKPQDDVVSHLLAEGYGNAAITVECLTYAAAGMVTTREFISLCAWHLLRDQDLRARYLAGDQAQRRRLLTEILRLEPIVRGLSRDLVTDLEVMVDGRPQTLPAGSRIRILLPEANTHPAVAGACPYAIESGRKVAEKFPDDVLAFGAGPHRCPGGAVAIQETDVLLYQLLQLPVRLVGEPKIGMDPLIASVTLRGLRIRVDDAAGTQAPAGSVDASVPGMG